MYYILHIIDKYGQVSYEPEFHYYMCRRVASTYRAVGCRVTIYNVRYKKYVHPNDHWHNVMGLNPSHQAHMSF